MELIEALKQLSLEVRNQEHRSISGDGDPLHKTGGYRDQSLSGLDERPGGSTSNLNWQYPSNINRQHQLREFDYSMDTLFAQISDLDHPETCQNYCLPPNRAQQQRAWVNQRGVVGSLETSQEEDSDCSSQRSGHTSNSGNFNPLVEDLLRKDLRVITDKVRKISQILALGKKIEITWNCFTTGTGSRPFMAQDGEFKMDSNRISTMCDTFASLLNDEPHIRDLPTIIRYRNYSSKLRHMNLPPSGNCDIDSDNDETMDDSDPFRYPQNIPVDSEKIETESIISDYGQVGNWTENRLYVNNQPH